MSAESSFVDNEILKTTPNAGDTTTPNSLDLKCSNLEANSACHNAAEVPASQLVDSKSVAALTSRDVLYTEACKEMLKYAKCYVSGYLPIIRLALNKLHALPEKSAALQTKMLELESVLVQIESTDLHADHVCEDDLYAIAREIGRIEDDFVSMRAAAPHKADADFCQQILEEVDFEANEESLAEARRLLVKNFAEAFDNFLATINEEERATEWELVDFYEYFKAATDFEEQFNYFDQFWAIFW